MCMSLFLSLYMNIYMYIYSTHEGVSCSIFLSISYLSGRGCATLVAGEGGGRRGGQFCYSSVKTLFEAVAKGGLQTTRL